MIEKKSIMLQLWKQLPFFVWLVALWMLLWGQFTWLAFFTGVVAAVLVTRTFRLPPVELSGRVNIFYGADTTQEEAEQTAALFSELAPQAEVNLLSGGQPIYYYLISAE